MGNLFISGGTGRSVEREPARLPLWPHGAGRIRVGAVGVANRVGSHTQPRPLSHTGAHGWCLGVLCACVIGERVRWRVISLILDLLEVFGQIPSNSLFETKDIGRVTRIVKRIILFFFI